MTGDRLLLRVDCEMKCDGLASRWFFTWLGRVGELPRELVGGGEPRGRGGLATLWAVSADRELVGTKAWRGK